jgi:3-oxoacyl-[acyl-carrier protein] reductase
MAAASELEGMAVLVTGAGGGIGSAVASECAAGGARLFLVDRDPVVEEVAGLLSASFAIVDLAEHGAPAGAVAAAVEALGSLEGVVQAAGMQIPRRPLAELEDGDWERLLAVNLTATMMVCRAAAATMKNGSIVNIGSISARAGMPELVAYSATKAAVHQLTQGLALELAPAVRVNVVAPGYVETGLTAPVLADPEKRRRLEAQVPMGHIAQPAEIAPAVRFLLSPRAGYITGEILTVDGGFLAH